MQFGINNEGVRVHIDQADPESICTCPICGGELIQRRGQKNIHHFAHKNACTDNWHYEEMSEWHRAWQERYPEDCREVVIGNHRADVLIGDTVIEFQHSPMSEAEFTERSFFYTEAGYKLVWLFDGRDRMPVAPNSHIYSQNDDGSITGGMEPLTEDEFVEWSKQGNLGKVYDILHLIKDTRGEDICYGCPINEKGYAPQIRCENMVSCDQCEHCLEYGEYTIRCAGRFKDYKYQVYLNGNDFVYFDEDGEQQLRTVSSPPYPGKSIFELALDYNAAVFGVRNLETSKRFKVGRPIYQFRKYGRFYGYGAKADGDYYSKSGLVYYSNNPKWVVEWFYARN